MKKSKRALAKASRPSVPVLFTLPYLPASQVSLAGSFNNWESGRLLLNDSGGAHWEIEIPLPPGCYEYLFVVDGRWMTDPQNPHTLPNPFGGLNSVVEVTQAQPAKIHP